MKPKGEHTKTKLNDCQVLQVSAVILEIKQGLC